MLEMSTQESLYSGLFALSIQGLKQNYLVISATNAAPQFLKELTPFDNWFGTGVTVSLWR